MNPYLTRFTLFLVLCASCLASAGAQQQRLALLIAGGVCDPGSSFARYGPNLAAPPNDVRLMADVLEGRYGFSPGNISIVGFSRAQREQLGRGYRYLSERATRTAILTAVTEIVRVARPNDYIVVYYSGHGAPLFDADEGIDVGTLVTYEGVKESAIRCKDLENRLDACPSRHLTLILDACFSGLFAKGFASRPPEGLEELQDLPGLVLEPVSKSLPVRQAAGPAAGARPRAGFAPIRDSVHNFTTLSACDEDEQTQEARFSGASTPLAISEFTWAFYHTLWQDQSLQTLEECHVALTKRLAAQRQHQTPQFRRGRQRSELIGPSLWTSVTPRVPLVTAAAPRITLGRLAGVSRATQFREEGKEKSVPDPQGATLRVQDLGWFDTTLTPVSGRVKKRAYLLSVPAG